MKMSVERLRWGLAGAVVLLVVGLVGMVGYGRYRALLKWKELLGKSGIHVSQESDNVTWSQTVKGRTVFTIRAKKAIPISDGKYKLRGVTLLLYGKTPNDVDRVMGDEFEYDEKQGVAKAIGDVHMDIAAPGALSRGKDAAVGTASPASPGQGELGTGQEQNVIHVLTSGLVYLRKLGVAATAERVEFRYAGLTCTSHGAEFDTGESVLHLLAQVEMSGEVHGRAMVVHAAKADLDRQRNNIAVVAPDVTSGMGGQAGSARAAHALLLLRPDGSLEHVDANGNVTLQSGGRRVAAERLEAVFGAVNAAQSAVLSGGVTLDGSAAKPMHGTAMEADLGFTPKGDVNHVLAKGGVRLVRSVLQPGAPPLAREMRGDRVEAAFAPGRGGKATVQQVHAVGSASARGESWAKARPDTRSGPGTAGGVTSTELGADDLMAVFESSGRGDAEIQRLVGQGNARLRQVGLQGADQESSADSLVASFAPDTRPGENGAARLTNASELGHVQIREQAAARAGKPGALSLAHGDRAEFDGAAGRLVLTGGAGYQQEGTSLRAGTISVEQGSGNAEAQANVEATLVSAGNGGGAANATHVLADRARLVKAAGTAEFFGTDAHPARLWQGGSQVTAADLYLDDGKQSLTARPAAAGAMVEAVFGLAPSALAAANTGVSPLRAARSGRDDEGNRARSGRGAKTMGSGAGESVGSGDAVHVTSPALTYSGLRHEAVCSGGVQVRQGETQVRAQQAVMFLANGPGTGPAKTGSSPASPPASPVELGGSLERAVFTGAVRLDSAGRAGEGDQLVYTARDSTYVLTGTAAKPPRMADAAQGVVTGPALVFRGGEKSVIVNGTTASNGHDGSPDAGHGGRVHTEVVVRPERQ